MEDSLIRKYKPTNLRDFMADNKIIHLLRKLITMETVNVLLVGNSGTGKSTLIDAIVNEYYENKSYENNILTITNLKDQGISYYRTEVKTFCQTASIVPNKKKILLLDDLDSINEQSQQVFRNCMDKYSHNVLFVASCTNPQKIIDSIQSRMVLIKLSVFTKTQLLTILNNICAKENISLNNDAIHFTIAVCNNSIRVLLNYLEKFKLINKPIDLELAIAACTNIPFKEFESYTELCKSKNTLPQAIKIMNHFAELGYSVMDILDSYFLFIKTTDKLNEKQKYSIIAYICKYISIFHNIHEDNIELAFFTNNLSNLLC